VFTEVILWHIDSIGAVKIIILVVVPVCLRCQAGAVY